MTTRISNPENPILLETLWHLYNAKVNIDDEIRVESAAPIPIKIQTEDKDLDAILQGVL